jgi:hypothetical protein
MTVMAWQPQEEPLRQLSSCLRDSLSGHNKNAQKQAELVGGIYQFLLIRRPFEPLSRHVTDFVSF